MSAMHRERRRPVGGSHLSAGQTLFGTVMTSVFDEGGLCTRLI